MFLDHSFKKRPGQYRDVGASIMKLRKIDETWAIVKKKLGIVKKIALVC